MKKILQTIICAVGGGMIGFFANRLNTAIGSACFTLGIVLLVASIIMISKENNKDK
jgi:FtsH-binding integral membrane protein